MRFNIAKFAMLLFGISMSVASSEPQKAPAEVMRELRMMMLTNSPAQVGIQPRRTCALLAC